MIKKLNEDIALKFKSISPEEKEAKGILGRLYGNVASFAAPTRNGRKYDQSLWEQLFDSDLIKERFANGGIFGQLNHPEYEEVNMQEIACVMPEPPVKDDKGNLVAYVDLVDTPCGRIAYQLAKYGYKFGISSRGTGDIIYDDKGEELVDPETYQLNAFDLVEIPAVESARLAFVESLDTKKKYGKTLKQKLTEEINKASDEDKKIMKETLSKLDINLEEKLADPSEEDINKIKQELDSLGFDIEREGKTLMGRKHFQLKLRGENHNGEDLESLADSLSELSTKFDSQGIPITWNIGLTDKFDITCGLDIDKKFIEEGYNTPMNFRQRIAFNLENAVTEDELEFIISRVEKESAEAGKILRDHYEEIKAKMPPQRSARPYGRDLAYYLYLNTKLNHLLDEELESEDGWGESIPDNLEPTFSEIEALMYEIRNCRRDSYAGFGDRAEDLANELNRLADELSYQADSVEIHADSLNETVEEDCSDKEEVEAKVEVVNDKDELVKELQEALQNNAKLEQDNLSLQEQLSVCVAKEKQLKEELKKNQKALINLSESTKKVNTLKEQLDDAGLLLNKKDKLLEANVKRMDTLKTRLVESNSLKTTTTELKESVKTLKTQLEEKDKLISNAKVVVDKQKRALKNIKESYIKAQAVAFGLNEQEIRSKLKESYSVKDIDSVCEELSERKSNLGKLPFRLNESTKINFKPSSNERLGNNFLDDDIVSDSLLRMLEDY